MAILCAYDMAKRKDKGKWDLEPQKSSAVEVPNIAYHLRRLFSDAELDKAAVIKEILIAAEDGKRYNVNHYNLQVIIALGFKIDNERAIAFRKWANQIVSEYTIKGWVMDVPRLKDGSPITDKYFWSWRMKSRRGRAARTAQGARTNDAISA